LQHNSLCVLLFENIFLPFGARSVFAVTEALEEVLEDRYDEDATDGR